MGKAVRTLVNSPSLSFWIMGLLPTETEQGFAQGARLLQGGLGNNVSCPRACVLPAKYVED